MGWGVGTLPIPISLYPSIRACWGSLSPSKSVPLPGRWHRAISPCSDLCVQPCCGGLTPRAVLGAHPDPILCSNPPRPGYISCSRPEEQRSAARPQCDAPTRLQPSSPLLSGGTGADPHALFYSGPYGQMLLDPEGRAGSGEQWLRGSARRRAGGLPAPPGHPVEPCCTPVL